MQLLENPSYNFKKTYINEIKEQIERVRKGFTPKFAIFRFLV